MVYSSDVRQELFNSAEEEFFLDNFTDADVHKNYMHSIELYYRSYDAASVAVERVEMGECLDNAKLNLIIQELIISHKCASKLRNDCDGGKLVNPGLLGTQKDLVENAIKGNQYLGNYGISQDLSDYEKGKWYSMCAASV